MPVLSAGRYDPIQRHLIAEYCEKQRIRRAMGPPALERKYRMTLVFAEVLAFAAFRLKFRSELLNKANQNRCD
jgi:hypothetical protein